MDFISALKGEDFKSITWPIILFTYFMLLRFSFFLWVAFKNIKECEEIVEGQILIDLKIRSIHCAVYLKVFIH